MNVTPIGNYDSKTSFNGWTKSFKSVGKHLTSGNGFDNKTLEKVSELTKDTVSSADSPLGSTIKHIFLRDGTHIAYNDIGDVGIINQNAVEGLLPKGLKQWEYRDDSAVEANYTKAKAKLDELYA